MIRLKDVAERAGVSLMTVSKVLRDASDVSQATKAKVRRVAEEMGYVPDALAQGLRTRKTKLFGLIIPSLTHALLGSAAVAIADRVQELGYDLLIGQTEDNAAREERCIRRFLARRVDGLFLYPVYRLAPTSTIYEELFRAGLPAVLLGARAPFCSQFAAVETDDVLGSYQLTRHLFELGHERIAFFAGPPAAPWAQERFEGYRRALREHGQSVDDHLVFSAGGALEDGQNAALQLINEGAQVSAVQTVSDSAAIGAALVFLKQGLRVPQDISVTGFGDSVLAEHFQVPLTTVRLPKMLLGQTATEEMVHLLSGEKPMNKRLPTELVVRASTSRRAPDRGGPEMVVSRNAPVAHGDDLE